MIKSDVLLFQFSREDFSPKDVAKQSSVDIAAEVIIETNPEDESGKSSYEDKITQLDEIMKNVKSLRRTSQFIQC